MSDAASRVRFSRKDESDSDGEGPGNVTSSKKKLQSQESIDGGTIHEAAERGAARDIARMVERNLDFDIDQRDQYGRTALMWAAELNHKDTVETLIDLGSDRKLVEQTGGRSALHLAARAGALDVLEVLLEDLEKTDRVEYVNAADKSGITPVFLAKQRGEDALPSFKYLMACGAKYNQQAWKEIGELPPLPPGPTPLKGYSRSTSTTRASAS
ncbi:hypothetical protein ABBQ38_012312 [Trebouxia sp. C0009 RCD-2024]